MALSLPVFTIILITSSLISPSHTVTNKKHYTFCKRLPFLNARLHWTYDRAKSTLSVGFVAPPESPDGWIAWAINPTGSGMIGAHTLVAFRDHLSGGMVVKTYNITGYAPPVQSPVWFDVKESSAESYGGVISLSATLVLPTRETRVNHVWQVGPSVDNGVLRIHALEPENLNSKGSLDLLRGHQCGSL